MKIKRQIQHNIKKIKKKKHFLYEVFLNDT
jgi:hypothetical protein